jgi:RNA-directed DNA polymerase
VGALFFVSLRLDKTPDHLRASFLGLTDVRSLAALLDTSVASVNYHLFHGYGDLQYRTFVVRKRSGGYREICAPSTPIKILQRKLVQVLGVVCQAKPACHGFTQYRSIVTNAAPHVKQQVVFNVDLEDFFGTINFGRVHGLFQAHPFNLPRNVATLLARLCTFKGRTPQGAPTSPIISNLVCRKMDDELQKLALAYKCRYTRFADDITFSTSLPRLPMEIGYLDGNQAHVGSGLVRIILENGFAINPAKVWWRTRVQRQSVTGITVNKRLNVRRRFVRQLRAILHAWRKFGEAAAELEYYTKYDRKNRGPYAGRPSLRHVILGKLAFIKMVRGETDDLYRKYQAEVEKTFAIPGDEPPSELEKLRHEFDKIEEVNDKQRRGYLLEGFLTTLWAHFGIQCEKPFTRDGNAEQIDGAFSLDGTDYLLEAKWWQKVVGNAAVDPFYMKLERSGGDPLGIFVAVKGWSDELVRTLSQNPKKRIMLWDRSDFLAVLDGHFTLHDAIRCKKRELVNRRNCAFSLHPRQPGSSARCAGKNADGLPCGNSPRKGSEYCRWHEEKKPSRVCSASKKDGTPCGSYAISGSAFCRWHQPDE